MIAVAVAMGFATLGGQARAGFIFDISQAGSNVVVDGTGSTDPTILNRVGDGGLESWLWGAEGWVTVGPLGGCNIYCAQWSIILRHRGVLVAASSATGDSFGLEANFNGFGTPILFLPFGYTAGTELSGTATYDNTTIAALGLAPGAYTYTAIGANGAPVTVFTVDIGSVPEPSSLALLGISAVAGLGVWTRRRNRTL